MSRVAVAAAAVVLLAAAGCSADPDDDPATPAPSPTAVGDRPRVEVLDAGAEPRRTLRLGVDVGASTTSTLVVDQDVATDQQLTDAPPITITFDTVVDAAGDEVRATQSYTDVQVADPQLRQTLQAVIGASDELVVGADGFPTGTAAADPQLGQVRTQVLSMLPVFPDAEVGIGATWTVTSVVDVDGATVDRTATYTLDELEDDAYVVSVSTEQQYRTGEVEGVEVTAGRGTVSGQFQGSLATLLPTSASVDVSTQVSYDIGTTITEVRTTIGLDLTTG